MLFKEFQRLFITQYRFSMAMAMTVNPKPRFKERQSRSFRSLQLAKEEQGINGFSRMREEHGRTNDRFQPLNMNELKKETLAKACTDNSSNESSAANYEVAKQSETTTPLEPIDELVAEKLDQVTEKMKDGNFTESDVQELLLSFTYTSGMIDNFLKNSSKKDIPLPDSSLSSLREALKKRWAESVLSALDRVDALQAKLFEYFWKVILYFNFWFPQLASTIRYVSTNLWQKFNLFKSY